MHDGRPPRAGTLPPMSLKRILVLAAVSTAAGFGPPAAEAATGKACGKVENPYPGTKFEGSDLTRVRAVGVSCRRARRVARGAHRKALGTTPSVSGIVRTRWNGWRVTGDLRGANDRYVAKRGTKRVRWRF